MDENLVTRLSNHSKSIITIDSASFHQMGVLQALAEKFGHAILPLSPYYSEFNLIENHGVILKNIFVRYCLALAPLMMPFCPFLDSIDYGSVV